MISIIGIMVGLYTATRGLQIYQDEELHWTVQVLGLFTFLAGLGGGATILVLDFAGAVGM